MPDGKNISGMFSISHILVLHFTLKLSLLYKNLMQLLVLLQGTRDKVDRAIRQFKNNKAPAVDEIPAELLKCGRHMISEALQDLFNNVWADENISDELWEGVITKLAKKGDLTDCNSWRGIILLTILGRAFCIELLNQLKLAVDILLWEEQVGFRSASCAPSKYSLLKTLLSSTWNTRCAWRSISLTSRRHSVVYITHHSGKLLAYMGSLTALSISSEACMTVPNDASR